MSTSALRALSGQDRHVARRFSGGLTPELARDVDRAGSGRAWFAEQLRPGRIGDRAGDAIDGWFPSLRRTPEQIFDRQVNDVQGAWDVMGDLSRWTVARRIHSRRQLHEQLVDFWSNLLHVPLMDDSAWFFRVDYDRVIRKHALRSFEDLLIRTTVHPAMGLFLDNAVSTKEAPNENLGRELLELHTVGVAARYTEDEVQASARILSGHTVDSATHRAYYDPSRHTTGVVSVLGFDEANTDPNDAGLAKRYLQHLARHPATARNVARKIAIRFVSDQPSTKLVEHLAAAYLRSGTDIKATLRALVAHPEFWAARDKKVRTPVDDVVATCRAVRVQAHAPVSKDSFAHAVSWTLNSTLCFQWPRPDGPPDRASSWASTTRMLNSWQMHVSYAAGWWPRERATYVKPTVYLPSKSIRFDYFVDHLCRVVLGRRSNARILQAACEACDVRPSEVITANHAVMRWNFVRLMAVLLDSPYHMTR